MKNVLVTGGTKGLGKAVTLELGAAGYNVLALYRADDDGAKSAEREFLRAGIRARAVRQDITLPEAGPALKSAVAGSSGQWNIVHCATASHEPVAPRLTSWESVIGQFATAVWGLELCTRLLMPRFALEGGTVVSVLSDLLHHPRRGYTSHAASQSALSGWSRCAAQELTALAVKIMTLSRARGTDPSSDAIGPSIAQKIRARFEDASVPGLGEDYVV